ncbi:hypothetical protein HII36_45870 [Nonomuraea sp. NN258]|nr:hypothetical protein [Nonomuraea antri]
MPSKEQVLRLLSQGFDYEDVGTRLGIPAGQAYLIATGVPADRSGTVGPGRAGVLTSRSQRLVNPREVNPAGRDDVRAWVRRRARGDRLTAGG